MTTDLHTAVESGCLEEVRRLLKIDGKNIVDAAEDPDSGETPLHVAARLGNVDIVRALLKAGADVSRRMEFFDFETLLGFLYADANSFDIAAAFGHASVIEVLDAAAGNQPIESDPRFGALGLAAVYGHLDILEFLLARLPVEIEDKTQALCFALHYGQVECARLLVSSGAETNQYLATDQYRRLVKSPPFNYPMYFALASPEALPDYFPSIVFKTDAVVLELVQILLEDGADINAKCNILLDYGRFNECIEANILSCAACNGRFEATKYLLAKGANAGSKWQYGWGILHSAVASGSPQTVDLLLKAGAFDQATGEISMPLWHRGETRKRTALDIIGICDNRLRHYSENNNNLLSDYLDIINMLVENGANVEAKDEFGNTALHSACLIGDFSTVAGCYINCRFGEEIYTDEYLSYQLQPVRRTLPLISAYLKAGANPNALNNRMQTPLHCLLMDVMRVIEGYSYRTSDWSKERTKPPIKEFLRSLCSTVQVLVAAGANLNQRNVKGYKPLHELVHGFDQYYLEKNEKSFREGEFRRRISFYTSFPPYSSQHEIDSVIVQLLQCGARSWELVPEPCFGAEKALFDIWKSGRDMDLRYLLEKLEDHLKPRLRMILRVLNRSLPGAKDVQMQILAAAL